MADRLVCSRGFARPTWAIRPDQVGPGANGRGRIALAGQRDAGDHRKCPHQTRSRACLRSRATHSGRSFPRLRLRVLPHRKTVDGARHLPASTDPRGTTKERYYGGKGPRSAHRREETGANTIVPTVVRNGSNGAARLLLRLLLQLLHESEEALGHGLLGYVVVDGS